MFSLPLKWHIPVQRFISHCMDSMVTCWVFFELMLHSLILLFFCYFIIIIIMIVS